MAQARWHVAATWVCGAAVVYNEDTWECNHFLHSFLKKIVHSTVLGYSHNFTYYQRWTLDALAASCCTQPRCPGRYGIGSFNHDAYAWVDFLDRARQHIWQVLPLGPTGYGDSPYQSFSTFAGNPYLIGLEDLVRDGLLQQSELDTAPNLPSDKVDYGALYAWKLSLMRTVADAFTTRATSEQRNEFADFCAAQADWLDDFALFMALKEAHKGLPWHQWSMDLRSRQSAAMASARRAQADAIRNHQLNQWLFARQWHELKGYANAKGIQIVGDIPIYVAMDSADVWANPSEFLLDESFQADSCCGCAARLL